MRPKIRTRLLKSLERGTLLLAAAALVLLGARGYVVQSGLPLQAWHTFVPDELTAEELDAADWGASLDAEDTLFVAMRTEVTQYLAALVPKPRVKLARFHGVFAPNSRYRAGDTGQAGQGRPACHDSESGGAYASRTPRRAANGESDTCSDQRDLACVYRCDCKPGRLPSAFVSWKTDDRTLCVRS